MTATLTGKPDLITWPVIARFLHISVRQAQAYATEMPPEGQNVLPVMDTIWGKAAWSSELAAWAKYRMHSHCIGLVVKRARRQPAA